MAASKLTEVEIRMFLMDKKELNPLLRGVRWSSEEIDAATNMSVAYYNETPPFIDVQNTNTFPYKYTLLMGVSGYLLKSASVNEASNQLNYAADGVTVQDKDKAEIFQRIGGSLWDEFKSKVLDIKIAINVGMAYGESPSELKYVAR